jgi:hypothetical protein
VEQQVSGGAGDDGGARVLCSARPGKNREAEDGDRGVKEERERKEG